MKAEIISIQKIFDDVTCKFSWQIILDCEDIPEVKVGYVELHLEPIKKPKK